ncbi:methyltransferase domain-containing protein [Mucilaginibacter sp. RS28]|uniref:Methyltransferase domain-containing protein n=1 Tax=Mucilaginibacter straminoryzae TaxID=2932774 RepID=A0A9X2BDH5_9SPHI|nr:methyltransferase domain-containing protein [Mucilaginibacter straminoryzae]MCJ8212087.1 methyltransferase domain-containing protein [Mucilaginibacter straminoryzae]
MSANYDKTSSFYDTLSRLVFGNTLRNAQISLLTYIPADAVVLIAGGGTGWILEEIAKVHSQGLEIFYVEISANMLALSQKRSIGNNTVHFINSPAEMVSLPKPADVIITPFLFDNFTQQAAERLFNHLNGQLKPGGVWLNTDFQIAGKWWHKPLLKSMYLFFKLFNAVQVNQLPAISGLFEKNNYQVLKSKEFFGRFILSKARKNG